jgi:ABC-type multidrug transport system fused ATPase/permease subunit
MSYYYYFCNYEPLFEKNMCLERKHYVDKRWYRPSVRWPQKGCVNFKNYSTKYRDDLDLVLKDITTTIHGGEKASILNRYQMSFYSDESKGHLTLGL